MSTTVDVTDRDTAIKTIRAALKARSGKAWSVRGGVGTSWGWIRISAPPRRCDAYGTMSGDDIRELAGLLDRDVHPQGVSVPASGAHRSEYVNRAEGRPYVIAEAYWD